MNEIKHVKLFEMVCSGNTGRSRIAEPINNDHLLALGLDNYSTISSGTGVGNPESDKPSRKLVEYAITRDVYDSNELEQLKGILQKSNDDLLMPYHKKAMRTFVEREDENRTAAVKYFGIKSPVRPMPHRTIVRPDVVAIFSMDMKNAPLIRKIYEGVTPQPMIEELMPYVTGNKFAEIPNMFGMPQGDYFRGVQQMLVRVPQATDKYLSTQVI